SRSRSPSPAQQHESGFGRTHAPPWWHPAPDQRSAEAYRLSGCQGFCLPLLVLPSDGFQHAEHAIQCGLLRILLGPLHELAGVQPLEVQGRSLGKHPLHAQGRIERAVLVAILEQLVTPRRRDYFLPLFRASSPEGERDFDPERIFGGEGFFGRTPAIRSIS